ncbi:MAG: regulatory protein RecX [Candidatus Zixiibacteriota bacterium]
MQDEQETIVLIEIARRGLGYLLTFSNDFEVRATKGTIDACQLVSGMIFSPKEFAQIRLILEEAFAFTLAEDMLARRAHSIGELKMKLRRKEIDDRYILKIIKNFKDRGILDDLAYGKFRATSLLSRKPAGRGFLIADLQAKLVPREIAERAVKEVLAEVSEVDSAEALLEKKRMSFLKFDLETARRKAYTYLSRRAISFRAAKEAFEAVFNEDDFK